MLELLNDIDTGILLALNGLHAPFWDYFMYAFSGKWIWVPMYAAILYVLIRNYSWRQTVGIVVCIGLAILFADQVCATLIRPAVERLRPSNLMNPISADVHIVFGYRGGAYGFPSCHAANSFALAAFVAVLFGRKKLTAAIFAWAALNSYSRLYLGVHYPGDLLVGAAIGGAIGFGLAKLGKYVALLIDMSRSERHALSGCRHTGVISIVGGATVACIAVYPLVAPLWRVAF